MYRTYSKINCGVRPEQKENYETLNCYKNVIINDKHIKFEDVIYIDI